MKNKIPEKIWIDLELINGETGCFYQKTNGVYTSAPIYNAGGMAVYVRQPDLSCSLSDLSKRLEAAAVREAKEAVGYSTFEAGVRAGHKLLHPLVIELVEALEMISKNSCCNPCREAGLVANKALARVEEYLGGKDE